MRKSIAIALVMIYFITSSGVAWGHFYCCGKLTKTLLFGSPEASHKCKGMKGPGCCDTKNFYLKIKDSHSATVDKGLTLNNGLAILSIPELVCLPLLNLHSPIATAHSPPSGVNASILTSAFLRV